MKKITAFLPLVLLALTTFAADTYQFPGWQCTDVDKLTAALAAAPGPMERCRVSVLLTMAKQNVQNYADFCAIVDSVVDTEKGDLTEGSAARYKIRLKKHIPYRRNIWIKDVWNFCQSTPSDYDFQFVIHRRKEIGMNDAQAYAYLVDRVLHRDHKPKIVSAIVDGIIDIAPNLTGVDVKADLQKMNRKFSKNLLIDKATWEPIIAKIRTTIETY